VNQVSSKSAGNVAGKKVLAVIFAVAVLAKLFFIIFSPVKWVGFMEVFLGHSGLLWVVYLILIIITGCYVFLSIDLLDLAVAMLFTSMLIGLTLVPYSASILKLGGEIATVGLWKAWPAMLFWLGLAVAILYRVFGENKKRRR
jgi:hypothetical protein